jgi:hypothetical protein
MGLADFCVSPFNNLLHIVESDIETMTSYYSSCQGTNPIAAPLTSASTTAAYLQTSIASLLESSCADNSYLVEAEGITVVMESLLLEVAAEASCPPIKADISAILVDGLCDDSLTGFFVSWLWLYGSCAALLLALVVVTAIHEHYGRHWLRADDDHDPSLFPYDEEEDSLEFQTPDEIVVSVLNPGFKQSSRRRTLSSESESAWRKIKAVSSVSAMSYDTTDVVPSSE